MEIGIVDRKPVYSTLEQIKFHALPFPNIPGLVKEYLWYLGDPRRQFPLLSRSEYYIYSYRDPSV